MAARTKRTTAKKGAKKQKAVVAEETELQQESEITTTLETENNEIDIVTPAVNILINPTENEEFINNNINTDIHVDTNIDIEMDDEDDYPEDVEDATSSDDSCYDETNNSRSAPSYQVNNSYHDDDVKPIESPISEVNIPDGQQQNEQQQNEQAQNEQAQNKEPTPTKTNSTNINGSSVNNQNNDDIDDVEMTRMFLKPIPMDTTAEDIRELFLQKGYKVADAYVPSSRGRIKGYGFVSFTTADECQQALKLGSFDFKGCRIMVASATGKSFGKQDGQKSNVLFLRNLPKDCSATVLKKYFESSNDIRLMRMDNGECRGIAFIEFANHRLANEAKNKNSDGNLVIEGRKIVLEFGKPKNERSDSYGGGGGGGRRRTMSPPYNRGPPSRNSGGYQRDSRYNDRPSGRNYDDDRSSYNGNYRRPGPNDIPPPPPSVNRYSRDYHNDRDYDRDYKYNNYNNSAAMHDQQPPHYDSYYRPPPPPPAAAAPSSSNYYDYPQESSGYQRPQPGAAPYSRGGPSASFNRGPAGAANPAYYAGSSTEAPRNANFDRGSAAGEGDYRRYRR